MFNTFVVFGFLVVLIVFHILLLSYMEASWLSQVKGLLRRTEHAAVVLLPNPSVLLPVIFCCWARTRHALPLTRQTLCQEAHIAVGMCGRGGGGIVVWWLAFAFFVLDNGRFILASANPGYSAAIIDGGSFWCCYRGIAVFSSRFASLGQPLLFFLMRHFVAV